MTRKKQTPKQTLKPTQKIWTKYTRQNHTVRGEINTSPSLTQQGMSVTMSEMIRRYTRGDIPPLAQSAFHGTDIDMDKTEGAKPMSIIDQLHDQQEAVREYAQQNDRSSVARTGAPEPERSGGSTSDTPSIEETSGEATESTAGE